MIIIGFHGDDDFAPESEAGGMKASTDDILEGTKKFSQWASPDKLAFFPTAVTSMKLEPALYTPHYHYEKGYFFLKEEVNTDELINFEEQKVEEILAEIGRFWNSTEKFEKFGLIQKRGILLYGPAGTGKTTICHLLTAMVVQRGGIVMRAEKNENDIATLIMGLKLFRMPEKDTPVVVLIEDVDVVLKGDEASVLLNVLDGVDAINNVLFVATTNNVENLEPRVVNRPSRFDRLVKVDVPAAPMRKKFLESLVDRAAVKLSGSTTGDPMRDTDDMAILVDLDKWVEDTEGLSMAHLKELFVAVRILDADYEVTLERLKNMKNKIDSSKEPAGFHSQTAGFTSRTKGPTEAKNVSKKEAPPMNFDEVVARLKRKGYHKLPPKKTKKG